MVQYCPIGYINETEELCRQGACALWSAYRECCSLLLFADTVARIEEKLPGYGKPIIENTTDRDRRLNEARGLLKENIEVREILAERAKHMAEASLQVAGREAWGDECGIMVEDLKWMRQLAVLLEETKP